MMSAPSSASLIAWLRPWLRAAPVMKATLPCTRPGMDSSFVARGYPLDSAGWRAMAMFDEVGARGVIAAGQSEQAASDRIRDLANEMFGKTRRWHKRIVRSGPHTLFPYRENPPDRVIEADDIVFADFGPIFEEFAADLGRTYVLGGRHAGHLVGEFPHEKVDGADIESYIAPGNTTPMRR